VQNYELQKRGEIMQVPVYGSNAYKYEQEYRMVPKKKTVVRRVRKRKKVGIKSLILPVAAVCMAFALLLNNSVLLEKNAKIEELRGQLDTVNAQTVAGEFEIERNMDLRKIEEEAITRLGMQRPTKAQTVYVEMGNCDYAETAEKKVPKKNIFSALADNVLEYFG